MKRASLVFIMASCFSSVLHFLRNEVQISLHSGQRLRQAGQPLADVQVMDNFSGALRDRLSQRRAFYTKPAQLFRI